MKTHNLVKQAKNVALLFAAIFTLTQLGFSQGANPKSKQNNAGKIAGKVVDAKTGETIIGANVVIAGSSQGDATDIDGTYSIQNLKAGSYSITATYVSYSKKTVTDVNIAPGEVTTVNIALQPETVGMDEVVVTASANRSGEAGLLSVQRKSVPVQDGISSEQIAKLGDSDVGAAMKRVTGVTVQNGKDVFVRGLGNRYSNVQLNGSQLPSTNPNKKEAPIDLFGSGLVSNITVQKTFTADQMAEFSGGSVQITTREFPEERNFTVSYSTSYNSVSTFDNILTSSGGGTDFLGYDDGKRSFPSFLNGQRVSSGNASQVVGALHNDWAINDNEKAIPSQSVSVNYANQFNEDKMPIGVVGNFSYKYDRQLEPNKTQRFIQFFDSNGQPDFLTDYRHDEGIVSADLSGMLNIFIKPSSITKFGLKTLYSNATTNNKGIIEGPFQNGVNRLTVLDFDRRTIFSTTLEGETFFQGFMQSTLAGHISYNRAMRERPDRRTTRYNLTDGEFRFAPFGGNNAHFFSDQIDDNYSAELKYEFKPADFLNVSTGGNAILKDRKFTARRIEYQDQQRPFLSSEERAATPDQVLSDENVTSGILELTENTQFGLNQSDWYDGYQTIFAGFISTKWKLINNFSIEIGGRVENSLQTIEVPLELNGKFEEASRVDNMDFLPAVNATYEVSDKTNIRAAFSRTLARPEFREISNFNFADFFGGRRVYGNPDLERTRITNYDLRFETYPNGGELFAVSAFYKQFDNPIELFYRLTDANEVFFDNAPEADLFGVEVEGRKNITERWQVVANASYIYSQTRMEASDDNRVANIKREMVGQSPFSINVSSFYTIPSWNMDVGLSYNTFGKRIVTVGKRAQQFDEYEQPFNDLGAKIDYKLGRADLSLEVSNLLNDNYEYTQGSVTTYEYDPGITYKMGVTFSF